MTMQGDELKALRKAAGMSQAELGDAIGMSQKFIGMMERGEAVVEKRTELAVRHAVGPIGMLDLARSAFADVVPEARCELWDYEHKIRCGTVVNGETVEVSFLRTDARDPERLRAHADELKGRLAKSAGPRC